MALQNLEGRGRSPGRTDLSSEKCLARWWAVTALVVLAWIATSAPTTFAQMNMPCHVMETQDETPPAELPVPQKMAGLGNAHMQITATAEAQMWFDQGLNLLHDFWDYESARAFEQSIRVDPKCAMCYWGLYAAESFYHSTAKGYANQALAQAVALKKHASKRERLYIEATAAGKDGSNNSGPESGASQALTLWRKLVRQYPADTQAKIFLAQSSDRKEELAILRSVLKDKPDDSAANHYYIHALESSEHPEGALRSAEILASLAPASGHMVHMPGHIFFRIGEYAKAEQAFTSSMQVDERYMKEQHIQPDNDWNYVHNLMYAIANFMEEGKLKQANAASVKLTAARGKLETTLYTYSTRDSLTRLDLLLPVALRTGDWALVIALLNASAPPANRPNLNFLARQLTTLARGMKAVENGDSATAETSSVRFDAGLWRISEESKAPPTRQNTPATSMASGKAPKLQVMPDALLQPIVSTLSIMSLELRASVLTAQGKMSEAKGLFDKAAQQEKALGYHEPPNYIRPVGETAGAAMIAAGDWADAKSAYRQALLERPRSGFALYGLAIASEKSGDVDAAAKGYTDFVAAWKNADPDLVQVAHAQSYLAEHRATVALSLRRGRAN
jgi:tetratricopeptide (TPR) repeat protein